MDGKRYYRRLRDALEGKLEGKRRGKKRRRRRSAPPACACPSLSRASGGVWRSAGRCRARPAPSALRRAGLRWLSPMAAVSPSQAQLFALRGEPSRTARPCRAPPGAASVPCGWRGPSRSGADPLHTDDRVHPSNRVTSVLATRRAASLLRRCSASAPFGGAPVAFTRSVAVVLRCRSRGSPPV